MLEHKRGKKSSHRQVFCKKRVGISAGFYCSWFGISRQWTLQPRRKSTGFISGDFKEGTMQHSQELHAKGSRPARSNITQEHTWQVWGTASEERKNHPTTQAVTWHWLSWTAHYRQQFQLTVRQEGWAAAARLSNKTKYKRPRRCTSKKETFVPLSPQTWNHH